jgi:nitronate monooxygenase
VPSSDTSGGLLAAETCRAGGLGFVAAGHLNSKEALIKLEREINIFRQADTEDCYPLAIGFIGHSTFGSEDGWRMFENILEDYQPQVIQCFAPAISYHKEQKNKKNVVQIAHSYGCKIIAQVGTVEEGIQALEAGVDAIIAQGSEAGGHGVRREDGNGTLSLTARLVKIAAAQKKRVPVLAAGGISDGRGLIAALSLGADGVVLGTRLWASVEAMGPASFKAALLEASSGDDVVRTRVFDTINNSYKGTKWPAPYDSSGTLRNETTKTWDGRLHEVEALVKTGDESDGVDDFVSYKQAVKEEDANLASVYCGEGVGEINSIDPAFAIIQRIEKEALKILQNLQTIVVEDNAEDEDTAEF